MSKRYTLGETDGVPASILVKERGVSSGTASPLRCYLREPDFGMLKKKENGTVRTGSKRIGSAKVTG